MAKKDKPHNERLFRCERLNVAITNMNMTPAKRDGGTYAYHDTLTAQATLAEDELVDLFRDMGIEQPEFIRHQSPQIWHWPLDGCKYYEHRVALKVSQRVVAEIEEAELYDFVVMRAQDQYKIVFKFKGIPSGDEHRRLELVYLDAKEGKAHHLVVMPPAQQELEGSEHEEEGTEA